MGSAEFNLLIDFCIFASGIYLIYCAIMMKKDKKIQNLMLSKDVKVTPQSDVEGFIGSTFAVTIGMGVIGMVVGAIGLYNDHFGGIGTVQFVSIIVYFVGLIAYGFVTVRAQKKYLQG